MSDSTTKTHASKGKAIKPSERLFENAITACKNLRTLTIPQTETEWDDLAEQISALLFAAEEYSSLGDCDPWADEEEPSYTMDHTLPFDRPSKLGQLVAEMTPDEIRTKLGGVVQCLRTLLESHIPEDVGIEDQGAREGWDKLTSSIDLFRTRQEADLLLMGLRKVTGRGSSSGKPPTSFIGRRILRIPSRQDEVEERRLQADINDLQLMRHDIRAVRVLYKVACIA